MTTTKLIEIRDEGTLIPALALRFDPRSEQERYLLERAGYGPTVEAQRQYVLLIAIAGERPECQHDPSGWRGGRTLHQAHAWLERHWDEIESGGVLDVQFILGESSAPKLSEARQMLAAERLLAELGEGVSR